MIYPIFILKFIDSTDSKITEEGIAAEEFYRK